VSGCLLRAVRFEESRADIVAEKLGSFEILVMRVRSGMSSPEQWIRSWLMIGSENRR
jgi:hypothetical protein